jgi:hypothetical protein
MKKTAIALAAVAAVAMLGAGPASAQEMALGTWTGTITPPGAEPVAVSYTVDRADGKLSIVMSEELNGEMPFQDVVYDGSVLVFWWDVGVRIDCALRWSEGSLRGTCADGRPDGQGAMLMTPPGEGGAQLR